MKNELQNLLSKRNEILTNGGGKKELRELMAQFSDTTFLGSVIENIVLNTTYDVRCYGRGKFFSWPILPTNNFSIDDCYPASRWPQHELYFAIAHQLNK